LGCILTLFSYSFIHGNESLLLTIAFEGFHIWHDKQGVCFCIFGLYSDCFFLSFTRKYLFGFFVTVISGLSALFLRGTYS